MLDILYFLEIYGISCCNIMLDGILAGGAEIALLADIHLVGSNR